MIILKVLPFAALIAGWIAATACAANDDDRTQDDDAGFRLTSSAFSNGGEIPAEYGCGQNRNPWKPSVPLKWSGAPEQTQSFVLLVDDPHPTARHWVHWLVTDIPAEANSLPRGTSGHEMPAGARELPNSWGESKYGGPCPPDPPHTYRFMLYAMPRETTDIEAAGKKGDALDELLRDRALARTVLEGMFH